MERDSPDLSAHYFMVQFPAGFLGALFDSLSFFVALLIVRRALRPIKTSEYISRLRKS